LSAREHHQAVRADARIRPRTVGKATSAALDEPRLRLAPLTVREIFHALEALRGRAQALHLSAGTVRGPHCSSRIVAKYGSLARLVAKEPSTELLHDPRLLDTYLSKMGVNEVLVFHVSMTCSKDVRWARVTVTLRGSD
jgi:hypothetical protein